MKPYLIAIDLDGTLLQDWETISQETIDYLKTLKKQGHKLVIATGRPFRSSERFHKLLELDTPIINYNGGLVTSRKDENFKDYSLTVSKEYIKDIFSSNIDHIENAFGEVIDDIYLYRDTEEIRPLIHYFNGATLTVGHFDEILQHDTNGFIVIAKDGEGHFIEEYVKEHYDGVVLSRNWGNEYNFIIELYTPETSKGNALEYVSRYLGFSQDQVIAIGDAHNDIEMLEFAGLGVCMLNGQDSLKAVADVITKKTNKENGLIDFLQEFFKEQ